MDKNIRRQFNRNIFIEMLSFWELPVEKTRELDGFESFIYETDYKGERAVLKISHTDRREIEDLEGEIDYTEFLFDNGVNVPEILHSRTDKAVHLIEAEKGCFTGVLYSFLPGKPAEKTDWNSGLPNKIGRFMGKMHSLSQIYEMKQGRRPDIFEEFGPTFKGNLDERDGKIQERVDAIYKEFQSIPRNKENWGMIHVDFHGGNFHLKDGTIHLFDFDDCQYSWFSHDIAMALFYVLPHHCEKKEDVDWGHDFLNDLLSGYRKEKALSEEELHRIPLFLKLRELELYALIKRSFDMDDLDPWSESYMKGRKEKLEQDLPYFPLDFNRIN